MIRWEDGTAFWYRLGSHSSKIYVESFRSLLERVFWSQRFGQELLQIEFGIRDTVILKYKQTTNYQLILGTKHEETGGFVSRRSICKTIRGVEDWDLFCEDIETANEDGYQDFWMFEYRIETHVSVGCFTIYLMDRLNTPKQMHNWQQEGF